MMNGNAYGVYNLATVWSWSQSHGKKVPGLVTRLVEQGLISVYLVPYSTRHTFITLQAQNGIDIPLLAAICGNSTEVIYRHYLGFSKIAVPINL
jgi:integrase